MRNLDLSALVFYKLTLMNAKILPITKIESLEPRLAPAGTVLISTSNGILSVVGDAASNGIVVTDSPLTGQWTISDALSGTTFIMNGVAQSLPFSIPAQNGIKMSMGDAEDRIEIQPSTTPSGMILSGGLDLGGGRGDDIVVLGNSVSQFLAVNGTTNIDLGDGNDILDLSGSALFAGVADFKGGLGDDSINLNYGSGAEHTYLKGFKVNLGAGADSLSIASGSLNVSGGALSILGAGQVGSAQLINFSPVSANLQTAATVALTAGNATVNFGGVSSNLIRFGLGLTVTTGAGDDSVNFNSPTLVVGALNVDLKDGTNLFSVGSSAASLEAGTVSIKAGKGDDTITLNATSLFTVNAALNVSLGSGTNLLTGAGAGLNAGVFNYTAGTTGDDTLNFTGAELRVLDNTVLNLGGGTNSTTIDSTTSAYFGGNLTISGMAGDDSLIVDTPSAIILGNFNVLLGNGTNLVQDTGAALFVGGALSYTGGTGNDLFDSSAADLTIVGKVTFKGGGNLPGGSDILYLRPINGMVGPIIHTGSAGMDSLQLGDQNGTSTTQLFIMGSVTGTMAAGDNGASINDTTIQGTLTIQSTGTVAHADSVIINQSTLNGAINLSLGAGASNTEINDGIFRGAFLANLGAGADTLLIDAASGTSALSSWYGTVKVFGGAGADVITLGSNPVAPSAGNIFYRTVTIDGGADADIFNQGNNTFVFGLALSNL